MTEQSQFTYFLSSQDYPVEENSDTWHASLPVSRHQQKQETEFTLSYGDYFRAVRLFLEENGCRAIATEASRRIGRDINRRDIKAIRVYLEKHGAFYHPARISTAVDGRIIQFVLNVAVSDRGMNVIEKEYGCLKKLNTAFSHAFIPEVYCMGEVCLNEDRHVRMFLGEWLHGYCECHISEKGGRPRRIVVWDPEQGAWFLTGKQAEAFYEQAALILTSYYVPETFEQIYNWHHAAGDFVLRQTDDRIHVRLITVREHRSAFEGEKGKEKGDLQAVMQGLLVFFLNLSVRMRLDRLDGTGEMVWADEPAVSGTVKGFFRALASMPDLPAVPAPVADCFQAYLSIYSEADLYDLSQHIIEAYDAGSPDVPVMQRHLKRHVRTLKQYLCALYNK